MPKSEDLSRSLEKEPIWTFDTEFQMIYVKWVKHEKMINLSTRVDVGMVYIVDYPVRYTHD